VTDRLGGRSARPPVSDRESSMLTAASLSPHAVAGQVPHLPLFVAARPKK
jgi:hypothetical protein